MTNPTATTWTAPVRYGEVDAQGVVFNAHYLTWCDEAMSVFCRRHGLPALAEDVRLVHSTLDWSAGLTWGDTVTVTVTLERLGRTSFALRFEIGSADRACCSVETTYVAVAPDGRPVPLTEAQREAISAAPSIDLGNRA